MSTIKEVLDRVDGRKPNAFTAEQKTDWIAELEGMLAVNVLLMDICETEQLRYSWPEHADTQLLVRFPHDGIYGLWLEAKIDMANGEYDKYQNSMIQYNEAYSNFVRWFARVYTPAQGRGGRDPQSAPGVPSYYITAYGLAVMRGFTGTLDEWLESLVGAMGPQGHQGEQGPQGPQGEKGEPGDQIGARPLTVTRSGEVAAEPVARYATVLEVVGTARYLEKVRVPVQLDDYVHSAYIRIYDSQTMDAAIAFVHVQDLTVGQHQVEVPVNRWFAPGESIVIAIEENEGNNSLLYTCSDAALAVDWLQDCPGSGDNLNEDTGDWLFDREDIKFVGELIFYDTLREELLQMEECTVSCKEQNFSEEQQAQARKNIGITNDPDIHAQFFTITDDGVVSLKPEYRGACPSHGSDFGYAISNNGLGVAGSLNAKLPKHLVIPELVDEIAVVSLAPGMFMQNSAVENLTLPDGITEIPDRFCFFAINLKNIYNTEQIKTIGNSAFLVVSLEKIKCPNLTSLGEKAFYNSPFLKYADIGNVTTIPNGAFAGAYMLSRVKGGAGVTTIEANALRSTKRLNKVDFPSDVATVGNNAFYTSGLECSWANLSSDAYYGGADIWSDCPVTAKENSLPTLLSQYDPRWADSFICGSKTKYRAGCVFFTVMHAYCALKNEYFSTVDEFLEHIEEDHSDALGVIMEVFENGGQNSDVPVLCDALGLDCTPYQNYGQAELINIYGAIAAGKYAFVAVPNPKGENGGHAVLAYGVKENGEFMIADSALGAAEYVGRGDLPLKYSIPYQNVTHPDLILYIISLKEE